VYDQIEAVLKGANFSVYPPATRLGKITAPYVVIHDMGTMPIEGSRGLLGRHLYEIVCMQPSAQSKDLPAMVDAVRTAMRDHLPRLRDTGDAQPTTGFSPDFDGAAMSVIYAMPVRLA
jgi:hypothetical protein